MVNFVYSNPDGSRGNDCVVRAAVTITGLPYEKVYKMLDAENRKYQRSVGRKRITSISSGGTYKTATDTVYPKIGLKKVGTYSKPVSIRRAVADYGPNLVVFVRSHAIAIVDGRVHDTFDSSRKRVKMVYVLESEVKHTPDTPEVKEPKRGKMWGQFVIVEERPGKTELASWHDDFHMVYEHRRRAEKVVWRFKEAMPEGSRLRVIQLDRAIRQGICHIDSDTGSLVPGRIK